MTCLALHLLAKAVPAQDAHTVVLSLCWQVKTEAQHIKFVVELYDKCQETCQQYIEFLKVRRQNKRAVPQTVL